MQAENDWRVEALWEQLTPQCPGLSVEVVAELPSTNATLMARAGTGAVDPCLLVAERQTAGRGRLGRTWWSQPGDSLTFSLGLPLGAPSQLQPHQAPRLSWSGLSLVVGVALAEALDARIQLKWPNDLWHVDGQGRVSKLGGILIETATLPDGLRWVVVGVGLNVRRPPSEARDLPVAASALSSLDPEWTAPRALHRVAKPLLSALQQFEDEGWAPWAARYAARDALVGRAIEVTLADGQIVSGVARGIASQAGLQVETPAGVHVVTSAEVSVRPC